MHILDTKEKSFHEEVKSMIKGNLVNSEYLWRSMEGEKANQNSHIFCSQIYHLILEEQKKSFMRLNEQRLLATLLCMQFYKDKHKKNEEMSEQEKLILKNPKYKIMGNGILIIFMYLKSTEKFNLLEYLIGRWVFLPRKIQFEDFKNFSFQDKFTQSYKFTAEVIKYQHPKYYSCLRKVSFPPDLTMETKRLAFSYQCSIDFIKAHKNQVGKAVYQYLLHAIIAHLNVLGQTHKSRIYFICVLYITKTFITYYGCKEKNILQQMLIHCEKIRYFPSYLGELASELYNIITNELKCYGRTFRSQVRKDFPCLGVETATQLHKEFYLITNIENVFSCSDEYSILNLRKMLICGLAKGCDFSRKEELISIVKKLNKQMTFFFYDKIIKLASLLGKMNEFDKVHHIYEKSLNGILYDMKNQSHLCKQQQIQQMRDLQRLLENQNQLGIFDYPQMQVVHVPLSQFTEEKSKKSFGQIAKNCAKSLGLCYLKNGLPLVILGDDSQFSQVLQIIGRYLQYTSIEEGRPIKLYCIPKPDATFSICNYIASRDLWYRRFLSQPFKDKLLYPHLDLKQANKDLFPSKIYNKMIHTYIRQAKDIIKVRLYKCYLTKKELQEEQQVYFCGNIAIGMTAQAQLIKQEKLAKSQQKYKKYIRMDKIEIFNEKMRSIESMNLNINFQEIYLDDKSTKTVSETNMKVDDLIISNLPSEYFLGNEPNPSEEALQLSILTDKNGKVFREEIKNKKWFKGESFEEVNQTTQAFKDFFINTSIQTIKIDNLGKHPLKVLIDGKIYSDIEKFRVQPIYDIYSNPVELNARCFIAS